MSKVSKGLKNNNVRHMILRPSTRVIEAEENPLKMKVSIFGLVKKEIYPPFLWLFFYASILDDFVGIRIKIPNKALVMANR